jgi:hypothetical protein
VSHFDKKNLQLPLKVSSKGQSLEVPGTWLGQVPGTFDSRIVAAIGGKGGARSD